MKRRGTGGAPSERERKSGPSSATSRFGQGTSRGSGAGAESVHQDVESLLGGGRESLEEEELPAVGEARSGVEHAEDTDRFAARRVDRVAGVEPDTAVSHPVDGKEPPVSAAVCDEDPLGGVESSENRIGLRCAVCWAEAPADAIGERTAVENGEGAAPRAVGALGESDDPAELLAPVPLQRGEHLPFICRSRRVDAVGRPQCFRRSFEHPYRGVRAGRGSGGQGVLHGSSFVR